MNEHLSSKEVVRVDDVRNVMALCREAHDFFGQKTEYNEWLWEIHQDYIENPVPLWEKNSRDPNLLKLLLVYRNKFSKLGNNGENFTFSEL